MAGKLVHGHTRSNSKTYRAWSAMLDRCRNPRNTRYKDYGGRGISVCERWQAFVNFLADMGEAPSGSVLDRERNSENYCKENCRWVTATQSNQNRRRNKRGAAIIAARIAAQR